MHFFIWSEKVRNFPKWFTLVSRVRWKYQYFTGPYRLYEATASSWLALLRTKTRKKQRVWMGLKDKKNLPAFISLEKTLAHLWQKHTLQHQSNMTQTGRCGASKTETIVSSWRQPTLLPTGQSCTIYVAYRLGGKPKWLRLFMDDTVLC